MGKLPDQKATILSKAMRYCAYQERCQNDVKLRLISWKVPESWHQEILDSLTQQAFINEARFARLFVRGKFTSRKWGRIKITAELHHRHIPEYHIRKALEEIDNENYWTTLLQLVQIKNEHLQETDPFKQRQKLFRYALSKGYESNIIQRAIDQMLNTNPK